MSFWMEERKSTYQYLPVSHTGLQDMDSTKSRTSQNPHSCRACCTRLRSGKCNVVMLIASAFILWIIIHMINSGEHTESAKLQELQAEDKSARDFEALKSDKLESEESRDGQDDEVYNGDETEDSTKGNNIFDHTEDDFLKEDSELDHYGSTESSVFRENIDADTDSANGSMEDMINKVIEDKHKLYDTEEETYEYGEEGKMIDSELTQDGFAAYNLEEDSSETEAEINVNNGLTHNDFAVDEQKTVDSENLKGPVNSLDAKSLRFDGENKDPVLDDNILKQEGLGEETDRSNKEHRYSNDVLLNIADTEKNFEEQSFKQNIAVNVDSYTIGNNSQLPLLNSETSNNISLTVGTNSFKESVNLQEERTQNINPFVKETSEDILHVDDWQSNIEVNQQNLNTDAKLAESNIENINENLVPDRINFAESFHKMVDPESDPLKFKQNLKESGNNLPDIKDDQNPTFIDIFKDSNELNDNTDMISNKNIADEIILPEPKAELQNSYTSENKDTKRKKRSLVHVLTVPLQGKKK